MWVTSRRLAPAACGVFARFGRGEVSADAGAFGPRQGRFGDQQVGVGGEFDQGFVRPAVGAVGDAADRGRR